MRSKLEIAGEPWFVPPRLQYCFTNTNTGVTMFDPYRFMLRSAYAAGIDVRLYTTPTHAAIQSLFRAVGLYDRY